MDSQFAAGRNSPAILELPHVWHIDLRTPAVERTGDLKMLSEKEHSQAQRFRNPLHRRRYVIAHGALREILAHHSKLPPEAIALVENPNGKPHLAEDGSQSLIEFSLSHSGDHALVAVSNRQPIGVDIERIDSDTGVLAIAQRYFSEQEQEEIVQRPATRRLRHFFHLWVCKEAYVKARGESIIDRLHTFSISLENDIPTLISDHRDPAAPANWAMRFVDVPNGFTAALAIQGELGTQTLTPHSWYATNRDRGGHKP